MPGPTGSSINSVPHDVGRRYTQAQRAGEILYGSMNAANSAADLRDSRLESHGNYGPIGEDELRRVKCCCVPMSDSRKSFCFVIVGDYVLCTLLWIVFTQIMGLGVINAYIYEIKQFTFYTSFFDSVMVSLWRMVVLLLAYGLGKARSGVWCALSLCFTLLYTVIKIIYYDQPAHYASGAKLMVNIFLLVGMVFVFMEILFLHCYVRPVESRLQSFTVPNEQSPLMVETTPQASGPPRFYRDDDIFVSLPQSPLESDNESLADYQSLANYHEQSAVGEPSQQAILNEAEYKEKAETCWNEAMQIYQGTDGWKLEKGFDLESGLVYSKIIRPYGKVFKLEGYVNASAETVFHELILKTEDSPRWNPTLEKSEVLQVINDNTDIQYIVASEGAGGLVSSRDFINLRHYKKQGDIILSSGCAIHHERCPPSAKYVRGENKPGGWLFIPADQPGKSKFVFIMNTDLKGWLPQWTVDQALSGTLIQFLHFLRKHITEISQDGGMHHVASSHI